MKKLLSAVLLVIMLASAVAADAETVIRGDEDRGIAIITAGLNEVPEGVSPTTGLTLSEIDVPRGAAGLAATGRYMPMLVQIDNADNGINHRAPWGAIHVDVVYESPLYSSGQTRISMLYSDVIPDAVGPVRSARLGHAWLREEWDCGFMYYGQQEYPATNVTNELKRLGADDKGVLFSGIVGSGRPWKKYYTTRKGLKQPHNKNGNAAAMSALIPAEHTAPNHAYLFTDEPLAEGDDAVTVGIHWLNKLYNSELRYDAATGTYTRYMHDESDKEWTYVDYDTKEPITFSNIIVQHCYCEWVRTDAPVTYTVGDAWYFHPKYFVAKGNADFFMNGRHVAGVWQRDSMESRTVFYGPDGKEMPLQRGRTLIIMLPYNAPKKDSPDRVYYCEYQ